MPRDYDDDDRPRRRPRRDEDDDDRPQVRKGRRDYDEDDDRPRRKRKRKVEPQLSVLGVIALATGILALLLSLMPCIGVFGAIPGLIGLVLGVIGLVVARKSEGAQSPGLPVAGLSVSLVAVLIAVGWLVWFGKTIKDADREFQEDMAAAAREQAQAARDVKAAEAAGDALRVTPAQFARAYDDDGERADALYKNKVIELTGPVDELDFTGETYTVHLKAGPEGTVTCEFDKDPDIRARLARLKPGQTVTIRGKCLGGDASLEACVLVEPPGE